MENAAEEIKALETEIVMFSRLRHPRVVKSALVLASNSLGLLMLHSRYFGTERLPDGNIRIFLEYLPGGSLQQVTRELQHRDDDDDGDGNGGGGDDVDGDVNGGGGGGGDDDDIQPSRWLTCEADASAIWPLGRGSGATHYAASIGRHTGIFKVLQFFTLSSRSRVRACSTSTARTSATATSKLQTSCARTSPASNSLTLVRLS
jgi:hypothetical protein